MQGNASRIFLGTFAFLFAWSASLQLNDADPLLWVGVYGWAALLCTLMAAGRRIPFGVLTVTVGLVGVWAVFLAHAVFTGDTSAMFPEGEQTGVVFVDAEEGRELGGLVFIAVVLGWAAWHQRRHATDASVSENPHED